MNKTLLFFKAPWCAPCTQMKPTVEEAAALTGAKLHIVDIGTVEGEEKAKEYGVRSVPTLFAVGTSEMERLSGAVSVGDIVDLLNSIN